MSLGVGIPSPTVISYGTDNNTSLFDLIPILKLFFFCHTCISFPIGWTSKFHTFQDHSGNNIDNPL